MHKIILVDDDRTNANLIKMLLEMDGFEVEVSPDIQGTYKVVDANVDAFIIDCNLARGDNGLELLRAIRNGNTLVESSLPVIMTSGDDRRSKEADDLGATTFLLKPYSPSRLSEELRKLLN